MPAFPEAGSTRPRRKILSALGLALALFASLMAFSPAPVDAVVQVPDDECYVEVEQSKYKRQTFETKYTYTKYVSNWFIFSGPSSWSVYASGAWTQTVTTGGDPHPYLSSSGNPIGADGLLHQTSGSWKRHYRYQITSEEQVATGWEHTGWLTEPPEGDGWVVWKTQTVKGDTFPCPDATATPGTCEGPGEITPSTSEHYTHEISGGVVTFTAVPPAVFGGDVQTVFDLSETIAQLEGEVCDEEVTPVDPEVTQSVECEVEGELVIPNTGGVQYLLDGAPITAGSHAGPISGTLTAEALDGHKLTDPEWSFEVDIAAAEDCPVDVTVSASLSYECDADVTVTLNSSIDLEVASEGSTEFEISVNGEVVATATVSGTEDVVVTINDTSTVVVTADGEEILDEVVEHVDCGGVLGDDEEAPEEEENGDVAGEHEEAPEETGATTLPMTGASAGLLTLLAGMAMGLGATLRTISRRLH